MLTDMSDAAGTWLLDEAARAWSAEAFLACEADPAWAPPLIEGSAPAGRIAPKAADELGLPRGVAFGRGRRRRGCRSDRPRRDRAGRSVHFARHRDPAHRRDRPLPGRAGKARPFFRPRAAESLVRHGGDAQRRRRAGFRRPASRRAAGDARARSGGGLSGPGQPSVPALSFRRADAARRPSCARRHVRPERDDFARRRRARGDGGRRADARGRARLPRRRGRFDRARRPHRRRREERPMDAHDRRGDRLHRRSHAGRRNRPGFRRRAPRADGCDRRAARDRLPAARNRRRDRARPQARRDVRRSSANGSRRSTAP